MSDAEKTWLAKLAAEMETSDCGETVTGMLPALPASLGEPYPPFLHEPHPSPLGGEPAAAAPLEPQHIQSSPATRRYILSVVLRCHLCGGYLLIRTPLELPEGPLNHMQIVVCADGFSLINSTLEPAPQPLDHSQLQVTIEHITGDHLLITTAPAPPQQPQQPPVQALPPYHDQLVAGMFKMP